MTPSVTTTPGRATATGRPSPSSRSAAARDEAAPFASALDGALATSGPAPDGPSPRRQPSAAVARAHEDRPHEPGRHGVRMSLGRVPGGPGHGTRSGTADDVPDKETDATGTPPDGTTAAPSDAVAAMPALWALIQGTPGGSPTLPATTGADGSAVAAVPTTAMPTAPVPTTPGVPAIGIPTSTIPTTIAPPSAVGAAAAPGGQQNGEQPATVPAAGTAAVPTAAVPTAAGPAALAAQAPLTDVLSPAPPVAAQPPAPQASAPELVPAPGSAPFAASTLPQPGPFPSAVPLAGSGEPGPAAATPPSAAGQEPAASAVDVSAAPTPGTAPGPLTSDPAVAGVLDELGRRSAENDGGVTGPDPSALLAPPAPAAPAEAPTAAAAAPPPAQPLATQVVQHLTVFRGGPDGRHSITVVLNPDQLGPVQVEVTLSRGTLDLTLRGAHATGREALLAALPELRRDLESAGLSCSRLDVDADTGGSWSAQHRAPEQQGAGTPADHRGAGGRRGHEGHGDRGRPAWAGPVHLGGGRPAPASGRSTLAGVDVRV